MEKTNVMRLLSVTDIIYEERTYDPDLTVGEEVAMALNEDPECVFKTLVTEAPDKSHYVFCIPVKKKLDLKKAAKVAGVKSVSMIPQKELLPLTGYIHGGCSPIGMKKAFPTFIDETAQCFDRIFISGGRRGFQIGLDPLELSKYIQAPFVLLTSD